jgi:hypothetical protein
MQRLSISAKAGRSVVSIAPLTPSCENSRTMLYPFALLYQCSVINGLAKRLSIFRTSLPLDSYPLIDTVANSETQPTR